MVKMGVEVQCLHKEHIRLVQRLRVYYSLSHYCLTQSVHGVSNISVCIHVQWMVRWYNGVIGGMAPHNTPETETEVGKWVVACQCQKFGGT